MSSPAAPPGVRPPNRAGSTGWRRSGQRSRSGDDRVGQLPAGGEDDQGGGGSRHVSRPRRQHVAQRSSDVQALAGRPGQRRRQSGWTRGPAHGIDQHPAAKDFRRIADTVDRLDHDQTETTTSSAAGGAARISARLKPRYGGRLPGRQRATAWRGTAKRCQSM